MPKPKDHTAGGSRRATRAAPMVPLHPAVDPNSRRAPAYSWLLHFQDIAGVSFLPLLPGEKRPIPQSPFVAALLDDGSVNTTPIGPRGFDQPLLRWLLRGAHAASLTTCGPDEKVYATAAAMASLGRNVVLVETLPQLEILWIKRLNRRRTLLPVLLCAPPETMH